MKSSKSFVAISILLTCACVVIFLVKHNGLGFSDSLNENLVSECETTAPNTDIYPDNNKFEVIEKENRLCYSNLSETQKAVYRIIDNAIYNMQTGRIMLGDISKKDMYIALKSVKYDNPEYFWISNTYSHGTLGDCRYIILADDEEDWLFSGEQKAQYEAKLKQVVTDFMNRFDGDETEYERELEIHEFVCTSFEYNKEGLEAEEANKEVEKSSHIVAAFFDKKIMCLGYSRVVQYLCYAAGIECGIITGTINEAHAWNVVNIDDKWYHLDATHDDMDKSGMVSMTFFNVTTDYMLISRTIDTPIPRALDSDIEKHTFNVSVPVCDSTEANYFVKNSLVITDLSQLEPLIINQVCAAVGNGKTSIEFCFDKSIGFVGGRTTLKEFIDVGETLGKANRELPKSKNIKICWNTSVSGGCSVIIYWENAE